ncbi:MAG TPA: hypothetical protein VNH17_09490 [Streptosporangiaceae bacterium]|nr:hypothetical protein [Streptosporangiaceae bacterium]
MARKPRSVPMAPQARVRHYQGARDVADNAMVYAEIDGVPVGLTGPQRRRVKHKIGHSLARAGGREG